jgi:cytochrome c peroxidase
VPFLTVMRKLQRLLVLATVVAAMSACSQEESKDRKVPVVTPAAVAAALGDAGKEVQVSGEINPRQLRRFQPVTSPYEGNVDPVTAAKVSLGRQLYFDVRLSKDRDLSCNSCHDLDAYGVDSQPTSTGHKKQHGGRNSPTVFNASLNFSQFWDGRAPDVEEQAKGPILNPIEMAMPDAASVETTLRGVPEYQAAFKAAFPGEAQPLTYMNVGKAIGAFERGLVTPGRWDRYLKGEKDALTAHEKEGLKTFLNVGCMVCHTGVALGGSMFERAGAVEPWPNQSDKGRANVTHAAGDEMMFKVPTLRNVVKTGPYFHDGSATSIDEAVRLMGKHQLGIDLQPEEVSAIVAWLGSLTATPPADYIKKPKPF